MNKAATPGLRFRHVMAVTLAAGDILPTPTGWATVTARTGIQDGIGGRYVAVAVSPMNEPDATREQRYDAESVVLVVRSDPAMPEPGTRVRTPFGMGSIVHPDGVAVVCYDVPAQQPPVKLGLVPIDKIEVIESGRGATATPDSRRRQEGGC